MVSQKLKMQRIFKIALSKGSIAHNRSVITNIKKYKNENTFYLKMVDLVM